MSENKWLFKIIIFVLIVGTYIIFAVTILNTWRKDKINNSPIVYITQTGEKYHRAYHYHRKNYPISLFIADEKGYVPCKVCHPPIPSIYDDKPKFYIYYWKTFSILISLSYWLTILYFYWKNSNK